MRYTHTLMETWRLLDTGSLSAAENMALDEVLLELKAEGKIPPTLRFLQFSPPCVLVGHHQSVEEEIRLDYCRSNGIEITAGSPEAAPSTGEKRNWVGRFIYRRTIPRCPQGLKISTERWGRAQPGDSATWGWTPGFDHAMTSRSRAERFPERAAPSFQGRSSFQGTVLVDFDIDVMLRALRIPRRSSRRKKSNRSRRG